MNKGLIWGMVGLGVGCAVLGGVSGHFISKATNNNIQAESGITAEKEYESYMLPDSLKNVSLTKFELNEKYDIVTGSYGAHLLNKETKEFKSLCFDNIKYVSRLKDNVYILGAYSQMYVLDVVTEEIKKLDIGFENYSIPTNFAIDNRENVWFYFVDNGASKYYIGMIDKDFNILKYNFSVALNNSKVILSEDYAFVMQDSSNYMSSYKAYCINLKSGDVVSFNGVSGYEGNKGQLGVKGNKLYFLGYNGSNVNSFNVIDGETSTINNLQNLSSNNSYKTYFFENYVVFTYFSSYANYSSYAVKYEDNSVIDLGKYAVFELSKSLYFSDVEYEEGSSTLGKVNLYKFNDELGVLDKVYSTGVFKEPYLFTGFSYAGVDFLSFSIRSSSINYIYKVTYDSEGKESFTLLNLKSNISEDLNVFELSNGADIFYKNAAVFYYDLKADEYIQLFTSGILLKIEEKDENVCMYMSDGKLYSFVLKDKVLVHVGYFDVEE